MSKKAIRKFFRTYGLRLIGIILLIYVLSGMDWPSLGNALKSLSIESFLLVIPLYLLVFPVKTLRWFYILRVQRIGLSWSQAFGYYTAGVYWGLITPGKLGELIKVFYLKDKGVATGKAVLGVLLDRAADIFFLIVLAAAGVLHTLKALTWFRVSGVVIFAIVLFMVIFRFAPLILEKSTPLITRLAKRFNKDPQAFLNEMQNDIREFSSLKVGFILFISFLSWVIYVIPLYYLGSALRLEITPPQLVIAILLSSGISLLPISIGGVGTRDSFLILYLGSYGIPKEKALVFSFMFVYMYIAALIFSWAVYMLSDIKKVEEQGFVKV